jgi:hypothetical protein
MTEAEGITAALVSVIVTVSKGLLVTIVEVMVPNVVEAP